MDCYRQSKTPFVTALESYAALHMVPFHTPGHKVGAGASTYQQNLFQQALPLDLGLMYALDDLFEPGSYIKEAEELAADLYGAGHTFFSVNGTTACIQAMIMATVKDGDEIIIPREAHRSVIGGLVLSGAIPVYLPTHYSVIAQISLGPSVQDVKRAIDSHPRARALLLINPSYYGIAGHITDMIVYAHQKGLVVLVDEAHGAHLPFHQTLPLPALRCGADCVAQSTHKLAGSVTQTSLLHCHKNFTHIGAVSKALAMIQSTSPNYLFLASLDSARQQLAMEGASLMNRTVSLAQSLRRQLNQIDGIFSFGRESLDGKVVAGFDETKMTIDFSGLALSGIEAELLLRQEHIEVELVQGNHVLALITLGDSTGSIQALIQACRHIAAGRTVCERIVGEPEYLPVPVMGVSPRQAWNRETECIPFANSKGRCAAETITYYPPGIPVLGAGEIITQDSMEYIDKKQKQGYRPNGALDYTMATIRVLK